MKKMFLFLGGLFSLSLTHFSHAQDGFSKLYTYIINGYEYFGHIIPKVTYDSTTNALYFPNWTYMRLKDEPDIRYGVLTKTDTNGIINQISYYRYFFCIFAHGKNRFTKN